MIYDDGRNITWYDFKHKSTGWGDANTWAGGLSFVVNGVTYSDWRLPTTVDGPIVYGSDGTTTAGYNITSSEMGHLFNSELSNKSFYDTNGNSQSGWGLTNTGPFKNLQPDIYWSGTEYGSDPAYAWLFNFYDGNQYAYVKSDGYYALAVRSGDVGAPVPVPGTILMLVPGLVGLFGMRKWKGRRHPV